MWFSRAIFDLSHELKAWGAEPRFEVGQVVARGFADLGFEEFQVLPGPKILSLTAGTMSELPEAHLHHFFWIPSVDECVKLSELNGLMDCRCVRDSGRDWRVTGVCCETELHAVARSLHEAMLQMTLDVMRTAARVKTGSSAGNVGNSI